MKNLESSLMKRSQNLICKICHKQIKGRYYRQCSITSRWSTGWLHRPTLGTVGHLTFRSSLFVCGVGNVEGDILPCILWCGKYSKSQLIVLDIISKINNMDSVIAVMTHNWFNVQFFASFGNFLLQNPAVERKSLIVVPINLIAIRDKRKEKQISSITSCQAQKVLKEQCTQVFTSDLTHPDHFKHMQMTLKQSWHFHSNIRY